MNYHNVERIINYGITYRRQELSDLLEEEPAWDMADDICAIMLTFKGVMPPEVWSKVINNLLTYTSNMQFELLVEEDEDDGRDPTGE